MTTEPTQKVRDIEVAKTIRTTFIVCLVVIAVAITCYLFFLVRLIVLDILIAILVAVALEPAVQFLMRTRMSRMLASILSVLSILIILIAVGSIIAIPLVTQGSDLIANAPALFQKLTTNSVFLNYDTQYQLTEKIQEYSAAALRTLAGESGLAFGFLGSVIGGIATFILIMVLSLFMLLEGPEAWQKMLSFLSPSHRTRVVTASKKVSRAVSGFVLGNLLTSLIAAVIVLSMLLVLHVPYAFALAGFVAFFDLIPLVGTGLATIVVGLVALTQGVVVAAIVVVIMLVYQFVEGHVLQPIIYSKTIALSPFTIILAGIVGAELGGILGVLLSIPFAAVIQIAIAESLRKER